MGVAFLLAPCVTANAQSAAPGRITSRSTIKVPAWLYPSPAPSSAVPLDSLTPRRLTSSRVVYTDLETHDRFSIPDWYPASHAPTPHVVSHDRNPALFACGYCHLPDGVGRPENAMLAGLPYNYIVQQLADMKARHRQGAWSQPFGPNTSMLAVADSATDQEVRAAARYFSRATPRRRAEVRETTTIRHPKAALGLYARDPSGGEEALGNRIIEMVDDLERHDLRDAHVGYVAYVPTGSISRGRELATSGRRTGGQTCASCHGPRLRGVALVPPIAGRSPGYILRQLLSFHEGTRTAATGAPMREVVAALTLDEMIALAAYVSARSP
ncbi:MAG: c-type cytochrome [Gemmatimonadaceae bacterium]